MPILTFWQKSKLPILTLPILTFWQKSKLPKLPSLRAMGENKSCQKCEFGRGHSHLHPDRLKKAHWEYALPCLTPCFTLHLTPYTYLALRFAFFYSPTLTSTSASTPVSVSTSASASTSPYTIPYTLPCQVKGRMPHLYPIPLTLRTIIACNRGKGEVYRWSV